MPRPRLLDAARATPPRAPIFAFVRPSGWSEAHPDLHAAFAELARSLGDKVFEAELPTASEQAAAKRQIVNFAEMSHH